MSTNIVLISEKGYTPRLQLLLDPLKKATPLQLKHDRFLAESVNSRKHQGIILELINNDLPISTLNTSIGLLRNKPYRFLILDGVTDPHHLGRCFCPANLSASIAVIASKK